MTDTLSGKALAEEIKAEASESSRNLRAKGIIPTLAVVIATDDKSANYYGGSIRRAAEYVDIDAQIIKLPSETSFEDISKEILDLAADAKIHGIILQTPLSPEIGVDDLRALIPPEKDIDGANPLSAGRLMSDQPAFSPATPSAVMEILIQNNIKLAGLRAVVVGRSRVVGMPLAHLLLADDATVTICHSKTQDLPAVTKEADLLVVAIGKANIIGREHVSQGAIVIDVGTNMNESGALVGDVDQSAISDIARAVTPVPGGVGPVTTAILLRNTVKAATKLTT